ncbi:hypothetical protein K8I61_14330, partial [bacterium]|nr:hypothetical protein [bacterium]
DGTKAARRHRVAAIALVALCMGNVAWEAPRSLANFERDLQQTRRAVLPAAAWVAKNVPKGECVAAHDIGALTFFTDAKILDLVGLTDARVVAAHKANDEAALWRLIEQDRCTHLVIFEAWDEMFFHFRENHGDRLRLAWRSPPGRTPLHRYSIWRVMTE